MTNQYWPLPGIDQKSIPKSGLGSFWSQHGNSYNCGIDLFAPEGTQVLAIEDGIVTLISEFTSKNDKSYYKDTKFVIVKNKKNLLFKYAGLKDLDVKLGDNIQAGQIIGKIKNIYDEDNLTDITNIHDIEYIRNHKESKLHLEIYKAPILEVKPYQAGFFLDRYRPGSIIDPTSYLTSMKNSVKFAS